MLKPPDLVLSSAAMRRVGQFPVTAAKKEPFMTVLKLLATVAVSVALLSAPAGAAAVGDSGANRSATTPAVATAMPKSDTGVRQYGERIIVAQRGGRRGGRRRSGSRRTGRIVGGIVGGIAAAIIAQEIARGNRDCRRWEYRCDRGDHYACRMYYRYCH